MTSYVTGGAIRALREKKGCTQRELAGAIGVTDKAVSKWETGKGLPDITLVEPLTHSLGVSVAELCRATAPSTPTARPTCCAGSSTRAPCAAT